VAATLLLYQHSLICPLPFSIKSSACFSILYLSWGLLPSLLRVGKLSLPSRCILISIVPYSRFENGIAARKAEISKRGIVYAPRGLQRRQVEEITITQLQEEILTSSQKSSEVELVQLVQEKIVIIDQTKRNKDNIRKNHFANVYSSVVSIPPRCTSCCANICKNTIIVIVTEVIDQRNVNDKSTRYMSRQIQSNVQSEEEVTIVIQESQQIIVGGSNNQSSYNNNGPPGNSSAQLNATAQVNPNVATVDPNSMSAVSNSTMLLPAGISMPTFGGMQVIQDPAIIIEANQKVFVEFVDQQQQQASVVDISAGEIGVTIESS
jgi:hypothetical protein